MNRFSRVGLLTALAAALAMLAAACGGGSSSTTTTTAQSASDWAQSICSAGVTWKNSLTQAVNSVKSNPSKDSVTSAADDVKSATSTLVDSIKALGPPNTSSGQQAKTDADNLADELNSGADSIKSDASQVSSAADLATALPAIAATASTMAGQVKTTVNDIQSLDTGELKSAFQNAPACKTLTSSSS